MDSDCGLIIQSPLSCHAWHGARVLGKEGYKKRVDAWVDQTLERMHTLGGNQVWWMFHGGQVLGASWPAEGVASKRKAYEWFENHITSGDYGVEIGRCKYNFPSPTPKRGKGWLRQKQP